MKLSEFYNLSVKLGIKRDPRKNAKIKSYADTALLYGNPNTDIKSILVGIDIEVGELLLADRLRDKKGLDLALSHHPEGRAWASIQHVMCLQADLLAEAGIPKVVAQEFLDERIREVERRVLPNNHMRSVDAARILDMPFMCAHTPADNHASWFIERLMAGKKPGRLEDIVDILKEIPEYKDAEAEAAGPRIILGNPKRQVGKIFVEMTGGTEGSKEVYGRLYKLGVRTLIGMHLGEEHFKKVKDVNLNVVIAGHISSDNLGVNLLLDGIENKSGERFDITGCSGFRRVRRKA